MKPNINLDSRMPDPVLNQTESDPPLFSDYRCHPTAWDELFATRDDPHEHCEGLVKGLGELRRSEFQARRANADLAFVNQGITFSVYSDRRGVEKIFPFDLIPRPVAGTDWRIIEAGLIQRIGALNLFLRDIYHDGLILRDRVIPEDLVRNSKGGRQCCEWPNGPGRYRLGRRSAECSCRPPSPYR